MRQAEGPGPGDGSVRTGVGGGVDFPCSSALLNFYLCLAASSGLLFSGWFFPFSILSLKQMLLLASCKDSVHAVQPNTFHISLILLCSLKAEVVTKLYYSRGEKEVLSANSQE